ncbi:hypothetical protein CMV_008881 [Castanea mollissima]|uniref:Uncharacterized protein n=1 Tax=Castanea mollissima TaxID=60419 RepID=A0A8J4VZ65_9ROSI|nr:hypothetical protein CMV_008881 [Castanea mollissima]
MKSLPLFAISTVSLAAMTVAVQGRLHYFAIHLAIISKLQDVHATPSPSPSVAQMPDVRTDAPTDQNLTKLQPNDSIVVNFGVSPTAEGSASSAHGQFLAVLTQPNGTAHYTQDPITPTNNTGPIGAPKSPDSPVLASIEPQSHTTSSHFDASNTSSSPPHLSTSDPSCRPSPPATNQILQKSKQLKRKITDQEVAHFVKRLKKTTNESEVVYFDPQTATLIPYSRLEYFILAERDKPTIVYSTKVRDSSSFSVPMAEEVGLIKPPTFP